MTESEKMDDELKKISKRLIELPEEICFKEKELLAINRKILLFDNRMKDIERKLYTEIYFEKNKEGKSLYSNEALRETEVNKKAWQDKEYYQLKNDEKEMIEKQHESKADIEKLKREFKSYEILVEINKLRLRVL